MCKDLVKIDKLKSAFSPLLIPSYWSTRSDPKFRHLGPQYALAIAQYNLITIFDAAAERHNIAILPHVSRYNVSRKDGCCKTRVKTLDQRVVIVANCL